MDYHICCFGTAVAVEAQTELKWGSAMASSHCVLKRLVIRLYSRQGFTPSLHERKMGGMVGLEPTARSNSPVSIATDHNLNAPNHLHTEIQVSIHLAGEIGSSVHPMPRHYQPTVKDRDRGLFLGLMISPFKSTLWLL